MIDCTRVRGEKSLRKITSRELIIGVIKRMGRELLDGINIYMCTARILGARARRHKTNVEPFLLEIVRGMNAE